MLCKQGERIETRAGNFGPAIGYLFVASFHPSLLTTEMSGASSFFMPWT
jgi:hypothetical protein